MTDIKKHFNSIAKDYDYYKKKNSYYYSNLKKLLASLIPPGKKVLDVGCGTGDLLIHLKPKYGVGVDISNRMIKVAKAKHRGRKSIIFSTKWPEEKFEYVFMSDVIEHLDKPHEVINKIADLLKKDGVFINTMANPIWEPLLLLAEKLGLKMPEGEHDRIEKSELERIIEKCGLKVVGHDYKLLMPIYIPLLTEFVNKHLEMYIKKYAFIEYFVCKKK